MTKSSLYSLSKQISLNWKFERVPDVFERLNAMLRDVLFFSDFREVCGNIARSLPLTRRHS